MSSSTTVCFIAFAVLVTACSPTAAGDDAAATVPASARSSSPTTVPAPPTTTSSAASTTTTVPVTTTTTAAAIQVEAPESAPTEVLESFEWSFATTIGGVNSSLLSLSSTGVFVDGDLSCQITTGFGGFDFVTGVAMVDGQAYLDPGTGDGYQTVSAIDPAFQESLGLCAGSERFWADITGGQELPAGGEPEDRNGIETRRLDLEGLVDQAGALGLVAPGVEGVNYDELTFWAAVDGGWITSMEMRAALEPETLESITGSTVSDTGEITVTLDVTRPNDAALSVLAP